MTGNTERATKALAALIEANEAIARVPVEELVAIKASDHLWRESMKLERLAADVLVRETPAAGKSDD